jgi:hypothetical protein
MKKLVNTNVQGMVDISLARKMYLGGGGVVLNGFSRISFVCHK